MIVVGSMIGSGISLWLRISRGRRFAGDCADWILTGCLTIAAALFLCDWRRCFRTRAGNVYLREAYSPLWGFLYGWTLFLVIQTGRSRRWPSDFRAIWACCFLPSLRRRGYPAD